MTPTKEKEGVSPEIEASPISQAFKINTLEKHLILAQKNLEQQKKAVLVELEQVPKEEESSEDQKSRRVLLVAEMARLDQELNTVRNGTIAEYLLLDKSIGAKHLADLESMKKAASVFSRVKVIHKGTDEVPSMNRCYEAFHHFSDLQASVQNSFPGFDCVLKVSGTDDIVASQSELLFAYMDKSQEAPVLLLELRLSKSVKKRKRSQEDIQFPDADNVSATKREGPWENGEIELFKAGVKEYGWGKWNRISQFIESRNPTQVRNFSTTVIGRRIRPSRVLTKGYLSLAAGFQVVAEELRANNPADLSEEDYISD